MHSPPPRAQPGQGEVRFATSGVTKVAGRACACEDFSFNIAVLKIKARATSASSASRPRASTVHEPNEMFTVRLSTRMQLLPDARGRVGTILKDDPPLP